MTRKTWLILGGVVIVVLVTVIGGGLLWFNSLLQFKSLDITYATAQTARPVNAACLGGEDSPGIAKEILDLQTDVIYIGGGANGMPDAVWQDYRFFPPILKNSTRNLLFDGSCFFRSPSVSAQCVGDDCFTQTDIVGYTWYALTSIEGQSCYPDASGCSGDSVQPGYVSITTIGKCHEITYSGPTIYELSDGQGNLYVMHATATGTPDTTNVMLPAGWMLTAREISQPLVLLPFGGGDECHYNVLRDNLVQAYHQYQYTGSQYPPVS